MGSTPSVGASFEQDIAELGPHNFTKQELKRLWHRFYQLSNGDKYITRRQLESIPELQLNPLSTRIAELFVDQPDGESISFQAFIQNLSLFHYQTNLDDKLHFLFRVYDRDNDGKVTEDELYLILQQCVGSNIEDAQLKLLVQGTMFDADKNGDKNLSYDEFRQCVERNPGIKDKLTVKF